MVNLNNFLFHYQRSIIYRSCQSVEYVDCRMTSLTKNWKHWRKEMGKNNKKRTGVARNLSRVGERTPEQEIGIFF